MKWRFWLRLPVIIWRLLWDKRVPVLPRAAVVLALVYLVLPMGIVPDSSIVGYLDDLALLILAVAWLLLRAPVEAVQNAQGAPSPKGERKR